MRRIPLHRLAAIGVAALLGPASTGCLAPGSPPLARFEFESPAMGTRFRIVLFAEGAGRARAASEAAFARIAGLDAALSDWDEGSELSRLSASSAGAPGAWIPVSEDLFRVLASAGLVSQATGGAFDVTVGPCVRLWRRSVRQRELPRPDRLADARAAVDWRAVQLDDAAGRVRLARADMRLDLGGIAKGYALDEALEVLRAHGVSRALVEGGGDVAAGAPPPGAVGWRVALGATADEVAAPRAVLLLAHAACATSGDLYQHVEIDGAVYSHVVDPATGLGSTRRVAASVVARTGMEADAWASAVCVLGAAAGLPLVEARDGLEARIVERAGEGFDAGPCESSGLARMMVPDPAR